MLLGILMRVLEGWQQVLETEEERPRSPKITKVTIREDTILYT